MGPNLKTVLGTSRAFCGRPKLTIPKSRPRVMIAKAPRIDSRRKYGRTLDSPENNQTTQAVATPPKERPMENIKRLILCGIRARQPGEVSIAALL